MMKRIISVAIMLLTISLNAVSQGTWNKQAVNTRPNGMMPDSVFIAPRDTASRNIAIDPLTGGTVGDSGRIAYMHSKYWGKVNIGGIVQWVELGAGAGGSVPDSRQINTVYPLIGGGDLSADRTISFDDTLYMKRTIGRTYPYDSAFYIPPSNPGAAWTLENMGGSTNAFSLAPKSILANEYTISMTNNIQYDTTGGGRWKVWNPSYPASYVESGWECITLHSVPSGVSIVNTYPHETFQARAGIDGDSLMNLLETWNQYKSPLVARYDTVFNTGATSYGWYGQDRRPFQWMFAEKAMLNGNVFANLDMYTSQAVSGAKFQFQRSRGKYAAQTALQAQDTIGNIMFNGSDGAKLINLGRIYAKADANGTTNNVASSITVRASNGDATTGTLSVTSGGNVGINNTAPSSVLHLVKEGFGGTVYLDRYTAGLGVLPPSIYGIASRGTKSSPSAILKNDPLISLNGSGYDGSTLDRNSRGALQIVADDDWSPTNKPTMLNVYLTSTIDDSRKVFSIDHNGHAGIGDTTDATALLLVQGSIKAGANSYSSGGYGLLVRNTTSGLYESVPSTTFAPSATNGYIELSPASRQSGSFSINTSSSIVSTGNATLSLGQTTATATNLAGLQIDAVNGDFIGSDYLSLTQLQTGHASFRNFNSAGNLTLGSGSSTSTNITLKPSNVSTFGGAVEVPNRTVTGNTTLNDGDRTVFVNNTGAVTITLPTAVGKKGRRYTVKKISAASNDVNIDQTGSETIDGSTSPKTLTLQWSAVTFESDNATWLVVGVYAAATVL
jgi:hypothetical protein